MIKREKCLKVASEFIAKGCSVAVGELRHAVPWATYRLAIT